MRLAGVIPGGSRKPLRRSRSLRPSRGASTVSTRASNRPLGAFDEALCRGAVPEAVDLQPQRSGGGRGDVLQGRLAKVLTTNGMPADPAARAVATSPSGGPACGRPWARCPPAPARYAEDRGRGVGRAATGQHPWPQPVRSNAAKIGREGPLLPRAPGQEVPDAGVEALPGRRL